MCGVTGVVELNGLPASPVVVRAMANALAHRGPDSEGLVVDGPVGFGHRRLAILDTTPAGQQPMATPDGRFLLNYNGEVFNFSELRVELEALGHRFRSRCDTEVVLAAWAEWGPASLVRLNGMFALAVLDRWTGEVVLARDRYGIKPLYWAQIGDALIFGSEVASLRAYPSFRPELDAVALAEYLTFQNLFSDRTLFASVRMLPAGCLMRVDPRRKRVGGLERYWDFRFAEAEESVADEEYLEELDRLFRQAVSRQLVADVPVSAYLSGGMDSGSIAGVAAEQVPNLRTFTVGFDLSSASGMELAFDEREKAERLSYVFSTEHYEMVLKAGDMERAMPALIRHLEDPRVGQCYPNYYAAGLASRFGTVVLSGAGGDELFGGYPWRYYRAAVNDNFDHYVDKYYAYWQRLLDPTSLARVLAPVWAQARHLDTREVFRDVFASHAAELRRPEDYVNHSLYFEAKTFLHGLLMVEDKLSMAHSLETRLPFLDNDLVDFAQRLPVRLKLGGLAEVVRLNENEPGPKTQRFFARTHDGKLLLRRAMARHVGCDIAYGRKQGFSGPDAGWFRGESIDYVRRRLMGDDAHIFTVLDRPTVHALVDDHLSGRENRRLLVWSFLCLEQWMRTFLAEDTTG